MIDGIGRGQPPRIDTPARAANLPAAAPAHTGSAAAALQNDSVSVTLNRITRELSASPPVDTARVSTLRHAIASGNYRIDPDRIAQAIVGFANPARR